MSFHVNEKGYYGEFGGAYIPEMLYPNVEELRQNYLKITADPSFQAEFDALLRDYVGRPTPLYFAERLSKKWGILYTATYNKFYFDEIYLFVTKKIIFNFIEIFLKFCCSKTCIG